MHFTHLQHSIGKGWQEAVQKALRNSAHVRPFLACALITQHFYTSRDLTCMSRRLMSCTVSATMTALLPQGPSQAV